jgi:transposase-like protein
MGRSGTVNLTDRIKEIADTYRESGLNVSETARRLGVTRQTIQNYLEDAHHHKYLKDEEMRAPNAPSAEDYMAARDRKIAAYQAKKRKGDWRKPVMTTITPEPYRLKVFGDPHLDNDGCDFELFERHWLEMSATDRVYGVCIGDWFDNWVKVLSHLYQEHSTPPDDAWLCLEHLMEQRGEALIAACSGNHDDWSKGPGVDPVDLLMKRHGVLYRKGAIRVAVNHEGCEPMFWSLRHKWRGKSMYSAAHWAASHQNVMWRDDLMVGGHTHQDDYRIVEGLDGTRCTAVQVSAFKDIDSFADVHGFSGQKISPVWDLVIDPRRSRKDPERIKVFWESAAAQSYMEAIS